MRAELREDRKRLRQIERAIGHLGVSSPPGVEEAG